jgi:hypothetical protein
MEDIMNNTLFVLVMVLAFIMGCAFGVTLFAAKVFGLASIAAWVEYYRAHAALFVMDLAWRVRHA